MKSPSGTRPETWQDSQTGFFVGLAQTIASRKRGDWKSAPQTKQKLAFSAKSRNAKKSIFGCQQITVADY